MLPDLHPAVLDYPLVIAVLCLIGWAALGASVYRFTYRRAVRRLKG